MDNRSQCLNRFILLGPVEAGKTTLFNALIGRNEPALKTQAMAYEEGIIDTPGEFFSHPRLYYALINVSAEAEVLIYVHPCNDMTYRLPPGLLDVNAHKRIIGVITKIDLPDTDPDQVEAMLRTQGFKWPVFRVSIDRPETIEPLREYLNQI